MDRAAATARILAAKQAQGFTFAQIANAVGRHEVWVTSAIYGQAQMDAGEARRLVKLLGLDDEVADALQEFPMKGSLDATVPVDPLIYRFHEITQVYGTTIKALIHEKFGDGIMSAIDFHMDIQRIADPKGDRVQITYNGKFLPYRKW
ncbi:MAG: cyanase [Egibacteraceae bacterium]